MCVFSVNALLQRVFAMTPNGTYIGCKELLEAVRFSLAKYGSMAIHGELVNLLFTKSDV